MQMDDPTDQAASSDEDADAELMHAMGVEIRAYVAEELQILLARIDVEARPASRNPGRHKKAPDRYDHRYDRATDDRSTMNDEPAGRYPQRPAVVKQSFGAGPSRLRRKANALLWSPTVRARPLGAWSAGRGQAHSAPDN